MISRFTLPFLTLQFLTLLLVSVTFGQTDTESKSRPKSQGTSVTELEKYQLVPDSEPIEKFAFKRYFTKDKFDRRITLYLSKVTDKSASKSLPLVVCVQGSGSQSVFQKVETGQGKVIASGGPEAVVARDFRDQVRVLVVEKPGVEFLVQPKRPGGAEESTEEFRREFTLERWAEAINAATLAVAKLDEIDSSKILVLGHSEGGQIACEVAAVNPNVTHVAVMAGGGPTQLFDFLQLARSGAMYNPNSTPQERVDTFLADWQKVLDDPMAYDKFILGHPHRRWTTFSQSSPVEAILKSKAKVFIAQGTEDTNSLPASAEVLYAELLARGRNCKYVRVEGGDHGFMTEGDQGKGWRETNGQAIKWFLSAADD